MKSARRSAGLRGFVGRYVLNKKLAVGLKERLHFRRQRIDGFIGDHPFGVFTPAKRRCERQDRKPGTRIQRRA